MSDVITWYDVLGVLPDAPTQDISKAWQARENALAPALLAGAPSSVLAAADQARQAVDNAWRILADPAAREAYDVEIGFERPGEGLAPRGPSGPSPSRHSRVVVPDVTGLFYQACLDVTARVGLRLESVQLTAHPMPVEGLVVGQTPPPGRRVRHDSMVKVQVWFPPEPGK